MALWAGFAGRGKRPGGLGKPRTVATSELLWKSLKSGGIGPFEISTNPNASRSCDRT
jgi:hypothetical protein